MAGDSPHARRETHPERDRGTHRLLQHSQRTERPLLIQRSPALLSLSFGALALLLSAVGIYALALRGSFESQLFGVQPGDPLLMGSVTLLLAVVALVACAVPAHRATRIEPMVSLAD